MKIRYEDSDLQELIEHGATKNKKLQKYAKDRKFMEKLHIQISYILSAENYEDLFKISPLHYERLKYEFSGYSSFRIGKRVERMICKEHTDYIELTLIQIDDTHYGNKN